MWLSGALCVLCGVAAAQLVTIGSSDDSAPTPDMAHNHGYVCQTHEVMTEDGYILEIHRLPGGRVTPLDPTLPPVLLQHGLLDSSADWLINGPSKALGYLLADLGYDVWLGNARGNTYSKRHRTLLVDDVRYWNWTWHEMGYYDLPAVIDHMLGVTGHKQILYVGHSMGTTMFFALCSTRPEYNAKVRYMTALAPVAFMNNISSPIRYLAPLAHSFEKFADYFGAGQFLPRNSFISELLKLACEEFEIEKSVCENYLFIICGHDSSQFDEKLLPIILGHNPAGTSTKTLVHYAQLIRTDKFQQFDYGREKNMLVYNATSPPQYNLSQITVPLTLHYGDNDLLTSPLDISMLCGRLANPVGLLRVNLSSFNHLDFLWARDVKPLVYDKVEDLIRRYRDPNTSCRPAHSSKCTVGVEEDTPLCVPPAVRDTLNKGKVHLKYLSGKIPLWKNSIFSKLQTLSGQIKPNYDYITI